MRIAILAALGLLAGAPVLACDYPTERVDTMPNGANATMDEMIEAQSEVHAYVSAMESYIECMDQQIDGNRDEMDEERLRVMLQRRDAAVDLVKEVAEEFNRQVRLYHESN